MKTLLRKIYIQYSKLRVREKTVRVCARACKILVVSTQRQRGKVINVAHLFKINSCYEGYRSGEEGDIVLKPVSRVKTPDLRLRQHRRQLRTIA